MIGFDRTNNSHNESIIVDLWPPTVKMPGSPFSDEGFKVIGVKFRDKESPAA